jgi:hypothetical protein
MNPPPLPIRREATLAEEIQEAIQADSIPLLAAVLSDASSRSRGCTSLVYQAVCRQSLPALNYLLEKGANAEEPSEGRRPIHAAEQLCLIQGDVGYLMIQRLLMECVKPDRWVEGDDPEQSPPLHCAAQRGCVAAVEALLPGTKDCNQVDLNGDTPLLATLRAMSWNMFFMVPSFPTPQQEIVDLLLQHSACPSQKDAHGHSALTLIPPRDEKLRKMITQADLWWRRFPLTIVARQASGGHAPSAGKESFAPSKTEALQHCLANPELVQSIAAFI